eukprot:TRINITY_DN12716_c0_g1_i2.p2 TRINITY_DN12716_c0_g1~~TRINITY_DN12716_c0_g1_i2.p2  ORF type:complete len:536 (-),score=92.33 TRINITY_DN12716_c0_g1_i2:189-1796(-)
MNQIQQEKNATEQYEQKKRSQHSEEKARRLKQFMEKQKFKRQKQQINEIYKDIGKKLKVKENLQLIEKEAKEVLNRSKQLKSPSMKNISQRTFVDIHQRNSKLFSTFHNTCNYSQKTQGENEQKKKEDKKYQQLYNQYKQLMDYKLLTSDKSESETKQQQQLQKVQKFQETLKESQELQVNQVLQQVRKYQQSCQNQGSPSFQVSQQKQNVKNSSLIINTTKQSAEEYELQIYQLAESLARNDNCTVSKEHIYAAKQLLKTEMFSKGISQLPRFPAEGLENLKEKKSLDACERLANYIHKKYKMEPEEYIRKENACIVIQKLWRGYQTRKILDEYFRQFLENFQSQSQMQDSKSRQLSSQIIIEDEKECETASIQSKKIQKESVQQQQMQIQSCLSLKSYHSTENNNNNLEQPLPTNPITESINKSTQYDNPQNNISIQCERSLTESQKSGIKSEGVQADASQGSELSSKRVVIGDKDRLCFKKKRSNNSSLNNNMGNSDNNSSRNGNGNKRQKNILICRVKQMKRNVEIDKKSQ